MNASRNRLFSLIAALSLSAGLNNSFAADSSAAAAPEPPAAAQGSNARRGNRLETLAKELDLTDAQKAKIGPLLKDQAQKVRELQQNQSLSAEDKRAKRTELRQGLNKQMKEILNAEQFAKWEKQAKARTGRKGTATPPPATTH